MVLIIDFSQEGSLDFCTNRGFAFMIGFDNLAISVGKVWCLVLMCMLKGRNPVVPGKRRSGTGPSVMVGPASVLLPQAKPGLWGTRYGLGHQITPGDRGLPVLGPPHEAVWQFPQREGGAALSCSIAKLAPSPAQIPEGGRNQAPCRHLRSWGAATPFSLLHREV